MISYNINIIIKIQKYIRGFLLRKKLKKLKDNMTLSILNDLIDKYNDYCNYIKEINTKLSLKKIRLPNYPSEISENIVKFVLLKKYNVCGNWDTKSGDLYLLNKLIEIKGFSSNAPSSFGPTEKWDWLYFIDCRDTINKKFKVYEIKLSNNNDIWNNIIISGKNDKIKKIGDLKNKIKGGTRPHICFIDIYKQLTDKYCKLIFDDYIINLL